MASDLRIGIVSDVHYGPPFEAKAGPPSLGLLREAIKAIEAADPALLIDLGDRVNNAGRTADLDHMLAVAAVFAASPLHREHVLGNHDLHDLDARENAEILGRSVTSRVVRCAGWDLVLWCADPRVSVAGFGVPASDLAWLAEALDGTAGPTAVFSHVPLGGGSMRGNYYFEGATAGGGGYANLEDIHDVLLGCDRLQLAVAGHVHWNSLHTVDGVPFLTVQSLTDLATSSPEPAGAWATLDLGDRMARMTVAGRDPWAVSVPLRGPGRRWLVRPELLADKGRAGPVELGLVEGVILDLDGVLYAGDRALPGAVDFLAGLRRSGRRVVAVTNHSGRSGAEVVRALASLGIVLDEREVVTSIDAVVAYLQRHHPGASVRSIGSAALRVSLDEAGFVDGANPDAVVAGYAETLDVRVLSEAAEAIVRGAAFVGTNPDVWLPRPGGERVPESGAILAYLGTLAGRRAKVVGKPDATIAALALERLRVPPERVMWVGDTLETDIAGAAAAGAIGVLVLTGNTPPASRYRPRPALVVPDLMSLDAMLREAVAAGPIG